MDDFLGFGYANLLNTGLLSCARTTYARYVTDVGMVCALVFFLSQLKIMYVLSVIKSIFNIIHM